MTHDEMLQKATLIATLLCRHARNLACTNVNDVPLMASVSISYAAANRDVKALDPRFKEILLFGSTARGKAEPGDIDMMVFDSGFYSNIIDFEPSEKNPLDVGPFGSWSGVIQENLEILLDGWFNCYDECYQFYDVLVDLQILPITIITNPEMRRAIGMKHADTNFFTNAFSTILRFDEGNGKFVPTTLRELEEKYQKCALV